MSYKKGLKQLRETTLAGSGTFGSGVQHPTSLVGNTDSWYAPGDARPVFGAPSDSKKKRKKKRNKFPLYRRHFANLMTTESVDLDNLQLDCIIRTNTPDCCDVIRKLLEKHEIEYEQVEVDIISFLGTDKRIHTLIEEFEYIIGEENMFILIGEMFKDKLIEKMSDRGNSNQVKGGKAGGMTVKDIAKRHGVTVEQIQKQLKIGLEIEMEHTNDKKIAKEISLDHLFEFPDYYTGLVKFEKELKSKHGERK